MTTTEIKLNVVIPICMENDFIGPKGLKSDSLIAHLPLHGGAKAANKILGTIDGPTPLDDIMEVIHQSDKTVVTYIFDSHVDDPDDPGVQQHFQFFGKHGVDGTEGALPVGRIAEFMNLRRASAINTDVLNLVTHQPIIDSILANIIEYGVDSPDQVRFLIMGGLTDVLVADCARGLNHICGLPNPYRKDGERWSFMGNVAVSDKYCFSNNNAHHMAALQGMDKVGIQILKTDQDIFNFLGIEA